MFIALLLLAGQSVSGNWTEVAGGSGSTTYVDLSTIKRTGPDMRTAWLRRQYDPVRQNGTAYEVAKLSFDCTQETSGLVSITSYSSDNRVLDFATWKTHDVDMEPQAPQSVGLGTLQAVCQRAL